MLFISSFCFKKKLKKLQAVRLELGPPACEISAPPFEPSWKTDSPKILLIRTHTEHVLDEL